MILFFQESSLRLHTLKTFNKINVSTIFLQNFFTKYKSIQTFYSIFSKKLFEIFLTNFLVKIRIRIIQNTDFFYRKLLNYSI